MYWLEEDSGVFPHPLGAHGPIIGMSARLTLKRLKSAYSFGIFPWYSIGDPILWWFPAERCVLNPHKLKIHKSMRNTLNRGLFEVSFDRDFEAVIRRCSSIKRKGQNGTWITPEMIQAYLALHNESLAHSVEVWQDGVLVGGLYGVLIGRVFCGESMFSLVSNASKVALIRLVEHLLPRGLQWIDAQQDTPHLRSLGSELITGSAFYEIMKVNRLETLKGNTLKF